MPSPSSGRIDPSKIEEVRKYLANAFPAGRFDDYPRGAGVAHLFVVTEPGLSPGQQTRHQLLITRQYFDRFTDHSALRDALESEGVAKSLTRAGERTVELY